MFYWNSQNELVPAAVLDADVIGAILSKRAQGGLWLNLEPFSKFGASDFVNNTFEYDLWRTKAYEHMHYRNVAVPFEISSDDAEDAPGGAGAHTVRIFYLDADYIWQVQTVTLAGETPVVPPFEAQSIYRMQVATGPPTGDSRRANIGTIAAIDPSGPHLMAEIPPGLNQTEMSHLTIPANRIAIFRSFNYMSWSGPTHNEIVRMYTREFSESGNSVFRSVAPHVISDTTGHVGPAHSPLEVFGPKTDLVVRAIGTSAVARPVLATYMLMLVDAG